MAASIAYHNARQLKLHRDAEDLQAKIETSYTKLGNDLVRLEKLEDAILKRLNQLSAMTTEHNLITEMNNI